MSATGPKQPGTTAPPLSASDEIRRLVESGAVDAARELATKKLAKGDSSVESWARILQPPRAVPQPRKGHGDFRANLAWLRAHRNAFVGRWVALRDGDLVASKPELRALLDSLSEPELAGALVVQVE